MKIIDEKNIVVTPESQKLKLLLDNCLWIAKRRQSQPIIRKPPLVRKESSSNIQSTDGMFQLDSENFMPTHYGSNPECLGPVHVQYSNYEQFIDNNSIPSNSRIKIKTGGTGSGPGPGIGPGTGPGIGPWSGLGTSTGTGIGTGSGDENDGDDNNSFSLNDNIGFGNNEKKVKKIDHIPSSIQ